MTQEQLKEAVRLNKRINDLKEVAEVLRNYENCRLLFVYDIRDGNGTPTAYIVQDRYMRGIEKILKDHALQIKQDIHTEMDLLTKKIEKL